MKRTKTHAFHIILVANNIYSIVMKKVFTLCVGVLLAAMSIYAQDIIVTNDAQKIEAKILEVSMGSLFFAL